MIIPNDKMIDTLELYKGLVNVMALASSTTSHFLVEFLYDVTRDIA